MARRQRYKKADIRKALEWAHGNVSLASKHLQCNRSTVYEYIQRYPDLEEPRRQGMGEILDLAESKLVSAIQNGNLRAIIFALRTMGSDRGWAERRNVDVTTDGEQIKPVVVLPVESFGTVEQAFEAMRDARDGGEE